MTEDDERHRLTAIQGLAALSLDALSSVAYGPEAILVVLVAAGGWVFDCMDQRIFALCRESALRELLPDAPAARPRGSEDLALGVLAVGVAVGGG